MGTLTIIWIQTRSEIHTCPPSSFTISSCLQWSCACKHPMFFGKDWPWLISNFYSHPWAPTSKSLSRELIISCCIESCRSHLQSLLKYSTLQKGAKISICNRWKRYISRACVSQSWPNEDCLYELCTFCNYKLVFQMWILDFISILRLQSKW
jgi:hypothetical protein